MGESIIERWVAYGSNLAGTVSGAAVGGIIAGPPGAVIGGAMGEVVTTALTEASHRMLSKREKSRIGAVMVLAGEALRTRLARGDTYRGDSLLRPGIDGRSPADEVIEHVLQVAQRSYEERKLPYLAATLATIAVSDDTDERAAHWLIRMIEDLSWPKLVALNLVAVNDENPLPDLKIGAGLGGWGPWSAHTVFTELQHRDHMLRREPRSTDLGAPDFASYFCDMKLTAGAKLLHWAADLQSVPSSDQDELRDAIRTEADG